MKPIVNRFYRNGEEAINAMETFRSMVSGVLIEGGVVSEGTLYRDYLTAREVAISFGKDVSKYTKNLTEFLGGK